MLKVRVMPTLLYRGWGLVKGKRFDSWRPVGSVMQAVKVYDLREVDELVFLDITATAEGREPDFELVDEIADECFMPLAVGGGVSSLRQVERLLKVGADKVCINTAALERPRLVDDVADRFGRQCVVASLDVARQPSDSYEVRSHAGTRSTGREPVAWARELEQRGAGEILLTSIDRDGTMEGYDLEITAAVAAAVTIPVIASGGAGSYADMAAALRAGASAVAAASIFHFTQQTPLEAKCHLRDCNFPVRI